MMIPLPAQAHARSIGRGRLTWAADSSKRMRIMKWETPEAVDFRFGMEITMYISNR
jgi:coenzyme PQQ precursor peptide PqqA